MFKVSVTEKDGVPQEYNFDQPEISIGRVSGNDIVLAKPNISKQHARIISNQDSFIVIDSKSTNGTFINTVPVKSPTDLSINDKIYIGNFILQVESLTQVNHIKNNHMVENSSDTFFDANPLENIKNLSLDNIDNDSILNNTDLVTNEKSLDTLVPQLDTNLFINSNKEPVNNNLFDSDIFITDDASKDTSNPKLKIDSPSSPLPQKEKKIYLGPIQDIFQKKEIIEIFINGHTKMFVNNGSSLKEIPSKFNNEKELLDTIDKMAKSLGHVINKNSPILDTVLDDGTSINIIIPPIVKSGSVITIHKNPIHILSFESLLKDSVLNQNMVDFLKLAIQENSGILISGKSFSGKTSLLNVLARELPKNKRIVCIEEKPEFQFEHPNATFLESYSSNTININSLIRIAVSMRPELIILNECNNDEIKNIINTSKKGSIKLISTIKSTTSQDILDILENIISTSTSKTVVQKQILNTINFIIDMSYSSDDDSYRINQISEIIKSNDNKLLLQDIFVLQNDDSHNSTGIVPICFQKIKFDSDIFNSLEKDF